ncbi:MAG: hypothetical protein JNN20_07795 [Betaproteobacteria bacterium]|nr:hypothetical protein [Betaproteobacteria bacterium]
MNKIKAVMLAVLGVIGLGYIGRSVSRGVINAGGKGRDAFVTFADNPGFFLFSIVMIAVISVGALVIAWRALTGKPDE